MKLNVKKLYCPSCQKLVKGREQVANDQLQILCSRCKRLLRFRDGITWKHT